MTDKTRRKRAVAVAQDVLLQIRTLSVAKGIYVGKFDQQPIITEKSSKKIAQELQQKHCKVCALGACFLSTVALYNQFQFRDQDYWNYWNGFEVDIAGEAVKERLKEIFSPEQQSLIEVAFEKSTFHAVAGISDEQVQAAYAFGDKYDNPRVCLRAIMKNIIKNNGDFVPPVPKPVSNGCQ